MLGDGGLSEGQQLDKIAGRTGLALGELTDDADTSGVSEGAEDGGGVVLLAGGRLGVE